MTAETSDMISRLGGDPKVISKEIREIGRWCVTGGEAMPDSALEDMLIYSAAAATPEMRMQLGLAAAAGADESAS